MEPEHQPRSFPGRRSRTPTPPLDAGPHPSPVQEEATTSGESMLVASNTPSASIFQLSPEPSRPAAAEVVHKEPMRPAQSWPKALCAQVPSALVVIDESPLAPATGDNSTASRDTAEVIDSTEVRNEGVPGSSQQQPGQLATGDGGASNIENYSVCREFMSRDFVQDIPKKHLCEIHSNESSSYSLTSNIKVDCKKDVVLQIWIHPRVRQADGTDKAMLHATTVVRHRLMKEINERGEICSIEIDAQIRHRGQRLNAECHPHSVDIRDGRVTFDQELVSCDKLESSAIKEVTLIVRTTFTIKLRVPLVTYCTCTEEDYVTICMQYTLPSTDSSSHPHHT